MALTEATDYENLSGVPSENKDAINSTLGDDHQDNVNEKIKAEYLNNLHRFVESLASDMDDTTTLVIAAKAKINEIVASLNALIGDYNTSTVPTSASQVTTL